MAQRVRVTDDFQVAFPQDVRERRKIEQGDTLLLEIRGNTIVLIPEPCNYARRLRSLHQDVWDGVNTDDYVQT